jgi:hypothetical protein
MLAKINKSNWEIVDYSSDEWVEGYYSGNEIDGTIYAAIDNDINTYWHTAWYYEQPDYPHWFIVDMGQDVRIASFECFRRQGDGRGQNRHQFEVSTNGTDWTDAGTFDMNPNTDAGQTFVIASEPTARYFRYTALQGSDFFANLAEINVYGYVGK